MSHAAVAGTPAGILRADPGEPAILDEGDPQDARPGAACGAGAGGQAAALVTGGGRR